MDVQQITALGIVALAAGWLFFRLWRQARGESGGCPGCGECGRAPAASTRPAPKATPLVTLDARPRRAGSPPPTSPRT